MLIVNLINHIMVWTSFIDIYSLGHQAPCFVQTLEGHTHNISAVCFHPELPIILTGSEDGTVRVWHATTYRQILAFLSIL